MNSMKKKKNNNRLRLTLANNRTAYILLNESETCLWLIKKENVKKFQVSG